MARVAIVTGGTRGIGFGIVRLLVKNSFIVYAVGTREKEDDYPEFNAFKRIIITVNTYAQTFRMQRQAKDCRHSHAE